MWIFTKLGFFSAVCARKGSGKRSQPVDPDRIMIRARLRSQLVALRERFPDVLGESEIKETTGAQYPYRLLVPKTAWVRVLAGLTEEMEYDSFIDEVADYQGKAGTAYQRSLQDVRPVMQKLQETEELLPITAKQIDAILPYLDHFQAADFSAGSWESPESMFSWFKFEDVVIEFERALYENGWVTPAFDRTRWQRTAAKFIDSAALTEKADATTIQKLFTTHCRADRFCEGHLEAVFENGHIVALLQRLKAIRQKMES